MTSFPFLTLALAFLVVILSAGVFSAAPWVPTRRRERAAMLKEVKIEPGQVVYDLGCGDGIVLIDLARRQPDARYVGFEIAPAPWFIGQVRRLLAGRAARNVSLRLRDFFGRELGDADVIFAFLTEPAHQKLAAALSGGVKPDAVIVIEGWPLPGPAPERVVTTPQALPFYIYRGRQFLGSA
jgi:SAM-dependent methyltransferase